MLVRGPPLWEPLPWRWCTDTSSCYSMKEAKHPSLAARQHSEEIAIWDSPGKGLGHRCHWCPGHMEFHLPLCHGADSRPCSPPPCRTACSGPSSKLDRRDTMQRDFCAWTPCQPASHEHVSRCTYFHCTSGPSARSEADHWCWNAFHQSEHTVRLGSLASAWDMAPCCRT